MSSDGFKGLAKLFFILLIGAACVALFLWVYPIIGWVNALIPVFVIGFIMAVFGYWLFGER